MGYCSLSSNLCGFFIVIPGFSLDNKKNCKIRFLSSFFAKVNLYFLLCLRKTYVRSDLCPEEALVSWFWACTLVLFVKSGRILDWLWHISKGPWGSVNTKNLKLSWIIHLFDSVPTCLFHFMVGKKPGKKTGGNLGLNASNTHFSIMAFTIKINIPTVVGVSESLKQINRCFKMLSVSLPTYALGWGEKKNPVIQDLMSVDYV